MAGRAKKIGLGLAIGCLGIPIALGIIGAVLFLGTAIVHKDDPPPKPETTVVAVPMRDATGKITGRRPDFGSAAEGNVDAAQPGTVTPGQDLPQLGSPMPSTGRPLRLNIDLEEGEFEIVPGPRGSAVRAEGYFDPRDFELTQQVVDNGELGQEVTIRFRRTSSILAMLVRGAFENSQVKVRVEIPEGVPIALGLNIKKGESDAELGGLMLTDLVADIGMGEHEVSFDRPIEGSLKRADIHSSMGEIRLRGFGNAHPEEMFLRGSMGEFSVDMSGEWPRGAKSTAQIRFKMGECRIHVPDNLRIDPDSGTNMWLGEARTRALYDDDQPADPDAPTLLLDISASMGEVSVSR